MQVKCNGANIEFHPIIVKASMKFLSNLELSHLCLHGDLLNTLDLSMFARCGNCCGNGHVQYNPGFGRYVSVYCSGVVI